MSRGTKSFAALAVVLVGLMLAMVFRRPPPPIEARGEEGDWMAWRQPAAPVPVPPIAATYPLVRLQANVAPAPAGAAELPGTEMPSPAPQPPKLDPEFSRGEYPSGMGWGAASTLTGVPTGGAFRKHKIVDGDTLRKLARRYLANADRGLEIYQLNRDLLPNPEVLPIGLELKIPAAK